MVARPQAFLLALAVSQLPAAGGNRAFSPSSPVTATAVPHRRHFVGGHSEGSQRRVAPERWAEGRLGRVFPSRGTGGAGKMRRSGRVRSSAALASNLEVVATMASTVFLHELGHFLAAYSQGMTVEEFNVGIGPKVLSSPVRLPRLSANANDDARPPGNDTVDVDLNLRLLPLGGYVRMPSETSRNRGDPDLSVNRPWPQQALVISGGILSNIACAWLSILIAVSAVGVPIPELYPGLKVVAVASESPSSSADIRPGDVIESFGASGGRLKPSEIMDRLSNSRGLTLSVNIQREGESIVAPLSVPSEGGVGLALNPRVKRVVQVKSRSIEETFSRTSAEFGRLWYLLLKNIEGAIAKPQEAQLAGPISIAKIGTGYLQGGGTYGLLLFAATLHLNLAVLNALPVPGLDGGQLAVLAIETAAGRRLNRNVVAVTTVLFQLGLLGLAATIFGSEIEKFVNDILRSQN